MSKEVLLGKNISELKEIVLSLGMPSFTAKQIAIWLYKKKIRYIEDMSDISLKNRTILSESFDLGIYPPENFELSKDGTKKYLFATERKNKKYIECVCIPDRQRVTLCLSCQSGCRMACRFCATATQGFQHHLTCAEILNQVISIEEREELTNFVFMGMGEPLDNWTEVSKALEILTAEWGFAYSPRRITVSTIGVHTHLEDFIKNSECHLAISLHSAIPFQRGEWMPTEKTYPIEKTIELLKQHDWIGQRELSFEYILFKGLNDTSIHAKKLLSLLRGLNCKVNLIPYHPIPGLPFQTCEENNMLDFRDFLNQKGLLCTLRKSKGKDIKAACGLLAKTSLPD